MFGVNNLCFELGYIWSLRDTNTCLTTAWSLCGQPQITATGLFVLGISVILKVRAFSGAAMLPRFYSSRTQTTALPNYSKRSQMTKGSYQPDRLISNAHNRSNRNYLGHFRWRLTSSEKRGGTWTLLGRGESNEKKTIRSEQMNCVWRLPLGYCDNLWLSIHVQLASMRTTWAKVILGLAE